MTSLHEQEVIDIYQQCTVELPAFMNKPDVRYINLEMFKIAAEKLMNKAYYYGIKEGMREAADIVETIETR